MGKHLEIKPKLQSVSTESFFVALILALSAPICISIVYRLYFHPLRKVPGPWLAAVTGLYGFYFNFIQEGGYSKRFKYLHRRYNSPVVRIGPGHVHVDSPEFFEEVFRAGSPYGKDPSFYKHFGGLDSMTQAGDVRIYRNHISSLYSARAADKLVPRLLQELQMVAKRVQSKIGTNETVNILQMFRTLSSDMVLQIVFPQDVNLFEFDHYHPFLEALDTIMAKTWLLLNYPFAPKLLALIGWADYEKLQSEFETFSKYCEGWANEAQQLRSAGTEPERDSHMTRYLDLDPTDEKKAKVIPHPLEDIFNFIAGGSDTTAYSTSSAIYFLLTSPNVLSKLQAELDENISFIRDNFDHRKIQNLPYLKAVVKEALRLSSPVPGCLPRVVPEGGARIGSLSIPSGTAVSVTLFAIQQNEEIFPEPEKFIPERWLNEEGKRIEKWNVAFSKGPRQCIGTNIAYLELHTCLAYLFSHFEFTLSGNSGNQLEWIDRFVACNTQEIKVKVLKDRWAHSSYSHCPSCKDC